jgi:hypothetical protein
MPAYIHSETCLQRLVVGIGLSCTDLSITVLCEINEGEILHLLRIGHRTRKVFLKQRLPALPGGLDLRHQPVQPAPFLLKAPGLVGVLYRASEKGCEVVRRERLLLIRPFNAASTSSDQSANGST